MGAGSTRLAYGSAQIAVASESAQSTRGLRLGILIRAGLALQARRQARHIGHCARDARRLVRRADAARVALAAWHALRGLPALRLVVVAALGARHRHQRASWAETPFRARLARHLARGALEGAVGTGRALGGALARRNGASRACLGSSSSLWAIVAECARQAIGRVRVAVLPREAPGWARRRRDGSHRTPAARHALVTAALALAVLVGANGAPRARWRACAWCRAASGARRRLGRTEWARVAFWAGVAASWRRQPRCIAK